MNNELKRIARGLEKIASDVMLSDKDFVNKARRRLPSEARIVKQLQSELITLKNATLIDSSFLGDVYEDNGEQLMDVLYSCVLEGKNNNYAFGSYEATVTNSGKVIDTRYEILNLFDKEKDALNDLKLNNLNYKRLGWLKI